MINFYKCCRENNIVINRIKFISDMVIIYSFDNLYLIKNHNIDIESIISYLNGIDFKGFDVPIKIENDYELYNFDNELLLDNYSKGKELVKTLIDLHNKSFSYIEYSNEKKNKIYNLYLDKINECFSFYMNLQDYIEEMSFIYPAYYLLLLNISKFYKLLNYGKKFLDKWYESNVLRFRESFLVENVKLENFYCGQRKNFINWDKSKRDLLIFDFVSFYKCNYDNFDIISLFDFYNSKITLSSEEYYLFFSLISTFEMIEFNESNYINTIKVRKVINYVDKTLRFILEKYEED